MQRGLLDPENDHFPLFDVTGCMYNLLLLRGLWEGSWKYFSNLHIADFEASTLYLLARTIETVEGGGLIILPLPSLTSLTSLAMVVMDVHYSFRTESHSEATGDFIEPFLLSIALCKACIIIDDQMDVLPISSHIQSFRDRATVKNFKEQLHDSYPASSLMKKCSTLDQGNAVVQFLDAILEKTLCGTMALLAARGSGKSAALGLAVAGAIEAGYSDIFVTAPRTENLNSV
ncbi:hypothetical protein OROMI_000449 [Orobanche minor]